MRLIANGTQVGILPAVAAPVGTPGYGTNGNPAAGQEATILDADVVNIVLAELMAVLQAVGIAPDNTGADKTQLLQALRSLMGRQMVVYASSGSWTVPAGVTRMRFRIWGGGGGGGGSANANSAGAGGGGAGFTEGWVAVTPGQVLSIQVGAGGAGGVPGAAGGAGGVSLVAGIASANPGAGGAGGNGAIGGPGGAGGTAAGGTFNQVGQGAGTGFVTGDGGVLSGGGGASFGSSPPGGAASSATVPQNGSPAAMPGAGGPGGVAGGGGGNGAPGLVIVEW
ncbi:hypothetical protein SAMN02745194_03145 [Roseomonas rosea]|uniref:Glycine-rich domain-containing protein n=1 Tax=Muricoccus roseus TaxID=198092 RepID=A0A1M6LE44_9PROT|nr:hypothetical protein [Roseomonas rosea]SHJ69474.1 hypothetical protein SAMN02745194_03145 [Roseomonas rosea]